MSDKPYKKRRLDQCLARQENPAMDKPPVTIEIADGPAIPRKTDAGLYSAWKFVVIAAPILLIWLCNYDRVAAFLLDAFPNIFGSWAYFNSLTEDHDYYRRAFNYIMPDGLYMTLGITFISILCTIPIGILTGLCRLSKIRPVNFTASVYVEVVRGIPLFVQLFYIYYAIGNMVTIPPMATGVIALSFCYGAYMGEVIRSGIEAIDRGQSEAALSLGFSPLQTMRHIVLPQAIRTILPPVGNECIALLKDSSMVSVIAIIDMMRLARQFSSTTYRAFEAYTTVALIYLIMTLLLSKLVSLMEVRMGRYERR